MHSVNHGFFNRNSQDTPLFFDGEEVPFTHDELAQRHLSPSETPAPQPEPQPVQAEA